VKATEGSLNPDLLSFWYEFASPGRIGLVHLDAPAARVINWAEKWVTPDGKPSWWTHVFLFTHPRSGVPWIAESDVSVPLPGFRQKISGPQENLIYKWCHPIVDRAAVADLQLSREQCDRLEAAAHALIRQRYTYRLSELAGTFLALATRDLRRRRSVRRMLREKDDSMHCAQFVRLCLSAAGCDPWGEPVRPENTVPEHYAQAFPIVAIWPHPPEPGERPAA